jgi:Domain of unknown function (DUF4388)
VVSLTGSLETFSLPDVLALLASSKKSGELSVEGERAQGRLWVEKGKLTGHEVGRANDPVDALFELLRLPSGSFAFEADRAAPDPSAPVEVAGIVGAAQARLGEWRAIEKVVPSLQAEVRMAQTAPEAEIVIRADQWQLLVTAAAGRTVISMMEETGLGEFDCCKAIKELAEARLLEVQDTPRPQPKAQPRRAERPRQARLEAPVEEEDDEGSRSASDLDSLVEIPGRLRGHATSAATPRSQASPAATAERPETRTPAAPPDPEAGGDEELVDELSDEPINRGLLLNFLSSVKN